MTITEKSFGNLPKEVSDYNASYPYNKLEKSQLTQTFINKFENNSLAFRKVNIVGNNLEFSFKAKDPIENNRSYMKNIKIPLKEVMDENNNLINDKFISQASNKMGKSFDSFVKEAVQQQQQIRIAEKKTQDKQLASV
ncbi:MAG: hypothetical protein LBO09_06685 [Candidatus Peribacteria bacterium]|nr:hypothetical protein [Candidatus Peribacteria bacterium]